ncbi:MAG: helix-turn-helix domain-containing protein [Candidatus Odinarchaeota archaeon]
MENFLDIITNDPEPLKIVNSYRWVEIILNPSYFTIIKLLEEGYKTVEEISKNGKLAKSTLYRYLRSLTDDGFVIKVGRRVKTGQIATENLYGKAARLFLPTNPWKEIWLSDGAMEIARITSKMIKHHFNDRDPDVSKLLFFIQEREQAFSQAAKAIIESVVRINDVTGKKTDREIQSTDDSPLPIINNLIADEGIVFFGLIGWITWFISSEEYEHFVPGLKSCFPGESLSTSEIVKHIEDQSINSGAANHDIILYKRQPIKFIPSELVAKYFLDLNYRAIWHTLEINKNPMTIKEIHGLHHKTIKKIIEDERCSEQGRGLYPDHFQVPKPKAENTVYRYVQDLIKDGLVIEVGQRMTPNQSFTQILYTAAAEFSILLENQDEFWKYSGWKRVTRALALILKHYLDKKTVNQEEFHEIITDMEKTRLEYLKQLLTSIEIPYLREIKPHEKPNAVIRMLGLVEWFIREEDKKSIREQLLACFTG